MYFKKSIKTQLLLCLQIFAFFNDLKKRIHKNKEKILNEMVDSLGAVWADYPQNFEEQLNEILALKSFYENTDDLEIIQEASIEKNKLNALQFKVNLECNVKPLTVEIWLPIEKINRELLQKNATSNQQHNLERSISGHHATTKIQCNSLPPLYLNVVLPASYPSHSSPLFTISCFWLNKSQLSRLCLELDKIWKEYNGMAVIYTWIEWLQMNTLTHLEVIEEPNTAIVMPLGQYSDEDQDLINEIRAVTTFNDIDNCINEFLRFNHLAELKAFKNSSHTCPLCFDEKIGTECFRLNSCKHVFCADCLVTYCEMLVRDGSIQLLKCPEADCKELVPEEVLRMVLKDEEYDRWERLLLQRTLDSMQDIMYCPRCSIAIVIEQNDNQAYCMNCRTGFCKLCREPFHVDRCLTAPERALQKYSNTNFNLEKILSMDNIQLKKLFKERDYFLRFFITYSEYLIAFKNNTSINVYPICPKCSNAFVKTSGCNKVQCICGTSFCYVCKKVITGYDHFNAKSCRLSDGMDTDPRSATKFEKIMNDFLIAFNKIIESYPQFASDFVICDDCKQYKLKSNKNVDCWHCTAQK